jgi:RNA polymerase sigma-70 factor (ECF subfamily)
MQSKSNPPSGRLEQCLTKARGGSVAAQGEFLELCRKYLLLVANRELEDKLRAKGGASDLVQETLLEAHRDFAQFEGTTRAEILAWLRRILLNNLANVDRHYRQTGKRQVNREIVLADSPLGQLLKGLVDGGSSPSDSAVAREEDQALQQALASLPEQSRQVIHWRNGERCPFEEIGRRLGRSAEAARKIWARAIERLQELLEPPHESA